MGSQKTSPQLRKAKSIFHLPAEIIEEILSRLPVKSLLKFRCVSKSWLSLIKSDRFIKIHYQNSLKNPTLAHHRVAYDVKEGVIIVRNRSLPSFLNSRFEEGSSSSFSIFDPTYNLSKIRSLVGCSNGDLSKIGSLVGCCNGVSCLLSDWPFRSFSLWNPATRVYVEIPKLFHWDPKWGFGWDESSGAFKVFSISAGKGQIYSSKTNSWKTISPGCTLLYSAIAVFLGGRLHWATRAGELHDEYDIESFDLESEAFERIELPPFNANAAEQYGRPHTLLGEIEGCLCALFNYKTSADVWVMKEYGVKDSWFKLLAFPIGQPSFSVLCPRPLLGKGPNGEMFVIFGDNFMVFSPKDGYFSRATNNIAFYEARVYVESLLSPQSNTT